MASDPKRALLKQIPQVETEYSLQAFNPLGAGGTADFFTIARTTIELAAAVKAAIDLKMPYLVIGAGAATLFSDTGFPGLVIHNQTSSFGVALDKSQVVVDSGISLPRLLTLVVGRGLGGLLPFCTWEGSIGGALYENSSSEGRSILSLVRYVTMIMPPTRIDKEATIVRYRSEWLHKNEGLTKLQYLRANRSFDEPHPVILTILLQLTNVRSEELQDQMYSKIAKLPPAGLMGPIFYTSPEVPLLELLRGAQVADLEIGGVYPNRYYPNYLACRGPKARSEDIRQLIEAMIERLNHKYGIIPVSRYQYVGVW